MSRQGPRDQEVTNGAAHVKLPQNAYGTVSTGELPSTLTSITTYTITFVNGLKGVTLTSHSPLATSVARRAFIAFNNTAFNDVDVAGLRYVLPIQPNEIGTMTFTFENSPLPTQMVVKVDAIEVATGDTQVDYTAVEA